MDLLINIDIFDHNCMRQDYNNYFIVYYNHRFVFFSIHEDSNLERSIDFIIILNFDSAFKIKGSTCINEETSPSHSINSRIINCFIAFGRNWKLVDIINFDLDTYFKVCYFSY